MGTDIRIHMEYRHRKKKQYRYAGQFYGERLGGVYHVLMGEWYEGEEKGPFPVRGLPGNVTRNVLEKYYVDKLDVIHYASWLTTEEVRICLDEASKRYSEDAGGDEWLQPYEHIYSVMKDYEDAGEPCRIVFWFDNC